VIATDSAAQYASGYLLYRVNTALVAQPFDPQKGSLSGTAIPLVNNLRDDVGVWRSIFSVSQNGLLIYQSGSADSAKSHLVLFDRSGKPLADYDPQEATITDARALLGVRDVRLSPDNKRVAFASGTGIWTLDLERKTKTRITFDQQVIQEPAWFRGRQGRSCFRRESPPAAATSKSAPKRRTEAAPRRQNSPRRTTTIIQRGRPMESI